MSLFPERVDACHAKDSGLALVLVFLLVGYFTKEFVYIGCSIIFLIIDMVFPAAYRPFAKLWIGISTILGTIMNKLILSLIFFVILTPVGVVRRLFGADPLQMKQWKKDHTTVFKVRDHLYLPDEIDRPY